MIASIRSEWLKIRTTAVPWVLGGIALVITALLILVYFVTHNGGGGATAAATAPSGSPTTPTPRSSSGTCWGPDSPAICSLCFSACSS